MSNSPADGVVFGLGSAWGFAPADLTSPARAAKAGAFTDNRLAAGAPDFTELRVHGVSGSDGATMLEHPTVLQVAGDSTTMFYRRWTPAGAGGQGVQWKLEAYSWGGLTESPLASASWLLLAPFMLYNVAHFALPPPNGYTAESVRGAATDSGATVAADDREPAAVPAQVLSRDGWHAFAQTVLRLLAFSATLQFTAAVVSILVSSVGLQARNAHFPSWLSWYPQWSAGDRVALAMVGVAAVIALLWLISVKTAQRYEARTSLARPRVNQLWPLTQTGFWKGQQLVLRHRSLHAGGAVAATAFIVSRPAHHMGGGRLAVMWISALVVALVVVSLCLPLADRHNVTLAGAPAGTSQAPRQEARRTLWCRLLLAAGAGVFIGAFFTGGWPVESQASHVTVPGFTNFCAFLLAAQVLLLIVLALTVGKMASNARQQQPEQDAASRPFSGGNVATVLAILAVGLGGVFGAVMDLFATRIVGTPVPSGIQFTAPPANALQIPWPIYAFAAAPVGLLIGLVIAAAWVFRQWHGNVMTFTSAERSASGRSEVADFYGIEFGNPDGKDYVNNRMRIARAWAVGRLVDQAAVVAWCAAAGLVAATGWAEIYAALASRHTALDPTLHGFAAMESIVGLFLAGLLVTLLRSDYSNVSKRKTIGALWDVATFWPRAAHPFAPPCYAERAVPELVDRIRILTGTVQPCPTDPAWQQIKAHERNADACQSPHLTMAAGPVLLNGYSQGSIIAPAVIAQLPDDTRDKVALLTLACPARRLYGRAFPAYFGKVPIDTLGNLLDAEQGSSARRRWKNLVRRSDYIGSWVFHEPSPAPGSDPAQMQSQVDQPCWDPVAVAADLDPTPPPIHFHSGFWQDPRVTQLGEHLGEGLIETLAATAEPEDPATAEPEDPATAEPEDRRARLRP